MQKNEKTIERKTGLGPVSPKEKKTKRLFFRNRKFRAYIGMTLSTMIVGLSFVFVKLALRNAQPIDLLAHRFTAATLVLVLLYLFRLIELPHFHRKDVLQLLGLSLFYPLLFFGLQAQGLLYTTAAEAGILSATIPVVTLLLAMTILKEKSSWVQMVGVGASVGGVIYIFLRSGVTIHTENVKGYVLVLLCVLAVSCYYILGRKINKNYKAMDITGFMIFMACLVFNVTAIVFHLYSEGSLRSFVSPLRHPDFIYSVLYLGVLSSLFTSLFSNYALSVVPASRVAVFNNVSPVISVMGGIVLLGEELHLYHYIGGIFVLLGVVATNLPTKRVLPSDSSL